MCEMWRFYASLQANLWVKRQLHVHHKQSTSLCRHSWLTTPRTTLTSSWKSMERSDGCQEKIVPRSETHPQKGQTHPAATGCADAAAVPKPRAALTRRRMGHLYRPAQSPADRKNVRGPLGVSGTLYAAGARSGGHGETPRHGDRRLECRPLSGRGTRAAAARTEHHVAGRGPHGFPGADAGDGRTERTGLCAVHEVYLEL